MNTEKIEKLKKSLSNTKIPADLKPKIEAEIKRLEDLDAKQEVKEEAKEDDKPVAKKTTTRKPRTTKPVAKKTSTAKPSQTNKPKRTAMSFAKEIRKEGENWKDAMARASKMMKEKSTTATKDVESELQKLTKLVRGEKNKEKVSRVSGTNLRRDASRKAKPRGSRTVTQSGQTSNKYGTFNNKLGRKYTENRENRTDRLSPNYPKNSPYLAEGGYLTDPTFGNFQNTMFADGGGIPNNYEGRTPEEVWNMWNEKQRNHFIHDHLTENNLHYLKSKSQTQKEFISLVTKLNWDSLSTGMRNKISEHISMGQYAKGGGIRRKNGQTYDYGRVWTKDHNEFDKGADHEVNYRRKKLAKGGGVESLTKELYRLQRDLNSSRLQTYRLGDNSQEAKDRKNEREVKLARFNEVLKELRESDAKFELGGTVVTDLAGHTGGGTGGLNAGMPLDGFSNTAYTGLVGETGAMSSGEMFAKGGEVKFVEDFSNEDGIQVSKNKTEDGKTFYTAFITSYPLRKLVPMNEDKDYVVKRAKKIYSDMLEYKKNEKYELGGGLPTGVSQSYMITEALGNPAQHFAKGGGVRRKNGQTYDYGRVWTNDHNQFDKGADHEVNYRRKGKFLGVFADGGETYNEKASQLKGGVDYYSVDIDLENGDEVRDLTFKSLDKAKKEFLKYSNSMVYDGENIDDIQLVVSFKNGDYENIYLNKGGKMATGGEVKGDKYDGKTEKIVEELKKLKGGLDNKAPYVYQRDGYIYISAEEGDNYADYDNYLYIDEKLEDFADKYDTYWDWENAGAIILVPLSDEYSKGGKMATGGGVNDESPRIYVADLEAYNNGRLSGVWLDLADYNDADELMEAIQDFLKTSGGEEYAIHDVEYIPNSMYSEYMGQKDFEELYEMIDLAKENDLPLSVVQEVVSQYDASAVDEFYGKYNDAEDFAQSLVDDLGIESFIDFEYYLEVSDTDKRLLAQDMADSYVEGIIDEDGGNRIIEEAGLDLDEYEEAESDRQEEMIDEAREIVYDEYYNNWIEGLSDPYYFLVEEQGLYSAEDFANADFVRIDYEKLADALEQDYTFIYDGGSLYVFNIR